MKYNLPELDSSQARASTWDKLMKLNIPKLKIKDVEVNKKGIVYAPEGDNYNVHLNHKGVYLNATPLENTDISLEARFNGDARAKVTTPLLGGSAELEAARSEGTNRYMFRFNKRF